MNALSVCFNPHALERGQQIEVGGQSLRSLDATDSDCFRSKNVDRNLKIDTSGRRDYDKDGKQDQFLEMDQKPQKKRKHPEAVFCE